MARVPPNHNKAWTAAAERQLQQLANGNTPTRIIGLKMGRTPGAVYNHANELGISLKPDNQSPYGTK